MSIKKLQNDRAVTFARMKAILDAAKADNERELTEAELDEYETLRANMDKVKAAIKREEYLRAEELDIDANPTVRSSSVKVLEDEADKKRAAWEKDRLRGFRTPREFLECVRVAGSGRPADERLKLLKSHSNDLQATAGGDEQGTYSDAYGGFFVPEGMLPGMLTIDPEGDPMAGRTTSVPMTNPSLKINARVDKDHSTSVSGGFTVGRRMETGTPTASRMQTEVISLEAHALFGLAYATEELLVDSPTSFSALIAAGFSDEFNNAIIDERINGTGVGQMFGLLNSPALITESKENNQKAATIKFQNLVKMRARCYKYSNAVWIANHDTLPQLMQLVQVVGTGGVPVWQQSAREGEPDMLLGRPLFTTEYCPTLGTKGDIILGNWREYLEGTYQPLQNASSMHVRFLEHERTFKFWIRQGGMPWWRSVLTPKNGSTLSPFVVLETRS